MRGFVREGFEGFRLGCRGEEDLRKGLGSLVGLESVLVMERIGEEVLGKQLCQKRDGQGYVMSNMKILDN